MSEDKNFEIEDEELIDAVGGKKIRKAPIEPTDLEARTRRSGGQRGGKIRKCFRRRLERKQLPVEPNRSLRLAPLAGRLGRGSQRGDQPGPGVREIEFQREDGAEGSGCLSVAVRC